MSTNQEKLVTAEELARILNVARYTIMKYARAGIIPAVKLQRIYRFHVPTVIQKMTTGIKQ